MVAAPRRQAPPTETPRCHTDEQILAAGRRVKRALERPATFETHLRNAAQIFAPEWQAYLERRSEERVPAA
jgi:hypothetical protein